MGFEPMTTEFGLDALTDRAIRPWVQLALQANLMQLLQFQLFVQYSHLVLAIVFVSRHICFKKSPAPLITLVAEWIDTYDIHNWRIFEVAIENWPELDFNSRLMNSLPCKRFCLKQMWRLTKTIAKTKCEHWTKIWNWSSCTKLVLSRSWTHSLIAQSVRASEWNSVVVGSNPTQANFL